MSDQSIEEIWVNTTEAGEITGYHRDYMQKLSRKMWKMPEEERLIRVNKRKRGYDIWLPDLIAYMENVGRGPQNRDQKHD